MDGEFALKNRMCLKKQQICFRTSPNAILNEVTTLFLNARDLSNCSHFYFNVTLALKIMKLTWSDSSVATEIQSCT